MGPSLTAISLKLKTLLEALRQLGMPLIAAELEDIAAHLSARHDHADPCGSHAACPCRKAESEEPPTTPYKDKKQPTYPGLHVSGGI